MILIDTNVYSALNRGSLRAVEKIKQSAKILIPVMVVGELRAGFLRGNRADLNNSMLNKFLSDARVEVVDVTVETTKYYAELLDYCRKSGAALTDNDIWIAALAQENSVQLVTFNQDFQVFSDVLGELLLILE